MTFEQLAVAARARANGGDPVWVSPIRVLAIDPGDTTGWAFFEGFRLRSYGQITGSFLNLEALILAKRPTVIVCEEYVLYPFKASEQHWSDMPVSQMIGVIKFVAQKNRIPVYMLGANDAKGFCTDAKLKSWGLYFPAHKHGVDGIRHGCYWIIHGSTRKAVGDPRTVRKEDRPQPRPGGSHPDPNRKRWKGGLRPSR